MLIEVQYFKMHFHFQIRMTTSKSNNCGWIESVFNFKATIEVKEFVGTPLPLCNVGVQLACASSSFYVMGMAVELEESARQYSSHSPLPMN